MDYPHQKASCLNDKDHFASLEESLGVSRANRDVSVLQRSSGQTLCVIARGWTAGDAYKDPWGNPKHHVGRLKAAGIDRGTAQLLEMQRKRRNYRLYGTNTKPPLYSVFEFLWFFGIIGGAIALLLMGATALFRSIF